MAESANGGATSGDGADTTGTAPMKFQTLAQYIRDMSFENIVAQKGIQGDISPEVSVQVALDVRKRPTDGQFEVISKYNVSSKNKGTDTTLFLMELEYAGIFVVEGLPDQQLHAFLLIECPRILFPFARRIIADATRDGGFPQLNLDNIDFVQIYRQTLKQRQDAAAAVKPDDQDAL